MATVTEVLAAAGTSAVFICDFSPPRGGRSRYFPDLVNLGAQFVSVAYNPGRSVRVDSVIAAHEVKRTSGIEAIFNMSPRDMNKLALESRLLGAQLLGLDNVVVIQGDRFTERDRSKTVNDYTSTELIAAVGRLNEGIDHRDSKLRARTHFCIGATIDPDRPPETESALTRRKVEAGAHYFITQAVYEMEKIDRFLEACGDAGDAPIFWGLQVLARDGFQFGAVPPRIRAELEKGRDAVEIALENYELLRRAGATGIYLMPPILIGGARDYAAAQRFLEEVRAAE